MKHNIVAWSLAWPFDEKRNTVNAMTTYQTEEAADDYARLCGPNFPRVVPLVRAEDSVPKSAVAELIEALKIAFPYVNDAVIADHPDWMAIHTALARVGGAA